MCTVGLVTSRPVYGVVVDKYETNRIYEGNELSSEN